MSAPEIAISLAEISEALQDIAESLDFIAARPEATLDNDTLIAIGRALGMSALPGEAWAGYRLRIYARLGMDAPQAVPDTGL